jgi:hypothetical protein
VTSPVYVGPITVSSTTTLKAILITSFLQSAVATAAYVINIPQPGFTVAVDAASVTVQAGQSGTVTVQVADVGGFNGNVALACSGLPVGDACSFSALTVPTSAGVSFSTMTINTAANTSAIRRNSGSFFPESVLAAAFCLLGCRKRCRLRVLVLLAVSAFGLGLLSACGGGSSASGPPPVQPVTTTVTVTATSGALSHAATFSLIVN